MLRGRCGQRRDVRQGQPWGVRRGRRERRDVQRRRGWVKHQAGKQSLVDHHWVEGGEAGARLGASVRAAVRVTHEPLTHRTSPPPAAG